MGIVSFLFGFHGRINRSLFFLASAAQGLLVLAGALVLASMGQLPDIKSATSGGLDLNSAMHLSQQISGVFVLWSALQLPLIFKRVRDMHETLTFAWVYSFFVFIGTAPEYYLVGHGLTSILVTWFSLNGSRPISDEQMDSTSEDEAAWNIDAELDSVDLVARARELKAAEAKLSAKHSKIQKPDLVSKPTFGKRVGMTTRN